MKLPEKEAFLETYGESERSERRYQKLAEDFARTYHWEGAEFFSAPGRTEIIGNHTDHNGGQAIAASIDMDTIGAAHENHSNIVRITSEGYEKEIVVDLANLEKTPKEQGTQSLVAGMLEGMKKQGFSLSGFDAFVSTNVIAAAGVSSSASFEMLLCAMVNYLFNEGSMCETDYAKIGKYAENVYWKKASGMMDQMACAVGGAVLFDFSGKEPEYRRLDFSFEAAGYQLVIVNTGKGHADLSLEYSKIPEEMGEAAKALGADRLCETTLRELLAHCGSIKNDRAVLRAIHFFEENRRVQSAVFAMEEKDTEKLLHLLGESGKSSFELLQNCYSLQDCSEQKISLALALSELFLQQIGAGTARVHGGGFAGVIACIVPKEKSADYVRYIAKYVGEENVYPMDIRAAGAVRVGGV